MNASRARDLMELFFQAPTVNALLVFEDHEYLGTVLKRDVEFGIREHAFELFENINLIRIEELERALFTVKPDRTTRVPVIDKAGQLLRLITYKEFLSQFHFEVFLKYFELQSVWDYLDHPVVITNSFKKILYLNREAVLLAKEDLVSKRFSNFLKKFEIKMTSQEPFLEKGEKRYRLKKSVSESKDFLYRIFQFFPFFSAES